MSPKVVLHNFLSYPAVAGRVPSLQLAKARHAVSFRQTAIPLEPIEVIGVPPGLERLGTGIKDNVVGDAGDNHQCATMYTYE